MRLPKKIYTKYKVEPGDICYKELTRLNELMDEPDLDPNMTQEEKDKFYQHRMLERSAIEQILQLKLTLYMRTSVEL